MNGLGSPFSGNFSPSINESHFADVGAVGNSGSRIINLRTGEVIGVATYLQEVSVE